MEVRSGPVVSGALVAGLLAGYGIAVPVGAVATYLVALTARTSLVTGVCAGLGVAAADGMYALVAEIGGAALLGRALTGRRGRLVTGLASNGLIAVLAVRLLLSPT